MSRPEWEDVLAWIVFAIAAAVWLWMAANPNPSVDRRTEREACIDVALEQAQDGVRDVIDCD